MLNLPRPPPSLRSSSSTMNSPHLRIFCVNDVYKPERFSQLKTLCAMHKSPSIPENDSVTPTVTKLVLPGDFLGGSMFAAVHQGNSVIDILNHLGVDYFTLGNHEFDFGSEQVAVLMDQSNFPWLGSNVRDNDELRGLFHATMDIDTFDVMISSDSSVTDNNGNGQSKTDCVKVGVFGVCTQHTPSLADPGDKVIFEDPVDHARRCLDLLHHHHHCDLILALTHVELITDEMIAELDGVDIIIGGHEHTPFHYVHQGTTIIKCGQNIDHLGVLDLHFSRDTNGTIQTHQSFSLISTEGVATDPTIDSLIQKWNDLVVISGDGNEVLCCVGDHPLSSLSIDLRAHETALACLVADAVCWSYQSRDHRCELGIQNGGFIRQDMVYKPGTLLTKATILDEMPFPRKAMLIELTLRQLRCGLEQMIRDCPAHVGSFPHLSADWKVTVDCRKEKLDRITQMMYQGEILDIHTGWGIEGMNHKDSNDNKDDKDSNTPTVINSSGSGSGSSGSGSSSNGSSSGSRNNSGHLRSDTGCMLDDRLFHVAISDFYFDKDGDGVDAFSLGRIVADHGELISHCVVDYIKGFPIEIVDGEPPGRLILLG